MVVSIVDHMELGLVTRGFRNSRLVDEMLTFPSTHGIMVSRKLWLYGLSDNELKSTGKNIPTTDKGLLKLMVYNGPRQ